MRKRARFLAILSLLLAAPFTVEGAARLVSVNSSGDGPGNGPSRRPQTISSGDYVVFESDATNLVSPATAPGTNIFVRNTQLQVTSLISVNSAGAGVAGNGPSIKPRIAIYTGRVVFESDATNLVSPVTNGHQIFVRSSFSGPTSLVSVNSAGNGPGNGSSHDAVISPDGRYVVFLSSATNLVSGIAANGLDQVYIRDLQLGVTKMVSVDSTGLASGGLPSLGPLSVSDDGRYVAFTSNAILTANDGNGFSDVYMRDVTSNATSLVSQSTGTGLAGNGASFGGQISRDGSIVLYTTLATDLQIGITDSNGVADVYLWYRSAGFSQLVSSRRSNNAFTGNGTSTTADGGNFMNFDATEILFRSDTTDVATGLSYDTVQNNIIDVNNSDGFGYTVDSADPTYSSAGDGSSTGPISVSYNGDVVAYQSAATNLTSGDTNDENDIFVHIRSTNVSQMASRGLSGQSANGDSSEPFLSDDGNYVVFSSRASDIDPLDTTSTQDIYEARICSGFLVDRFDDEGPAFPGSGTCQAVSGGCTLRAAVDAANSNGGGLVCLPAGTYTLSLGTIPIYSAVTIDGEGSFSTFIDGDFENQPFDIYNLSNTARARKAAPERGGRRTKQAINVAISNVQIVNGFSNSDGGAIELESDMALYLFAVTFTNNFAGDGSGGAIAAYSGSELHVTSSEFDNNAASFQGGAIWSDGLLTIGTTRFFCNVAGSGFNSNCSNGGSGQTTRRESRAARSRPRKPGESFVGDGGGVWLGDSNFGQNQNTITDAEFFYNAAGSQGGGLYTNFNALLTADRVTVASNDAFNLGGGIYNAGAITLSNATITGNTSFGSPGVGFSNGSVGQSTITNATIARNSLVDQGSEIENNGNTLSIGNSIVSGDITCTGAGSISSLGHNIENLGSCGFTGAGDIQNTNPKLDPNLQYNGGFEQTILLLPSSPAIDAGDDQLCPATDERGVTRPQGAHCDMGAVEMIGITISDVSMAEGDSGTTNFVFTVTLSAPNPNTVSVDYTTADDTATLANSDYVQTSGTLFFPFGGTSATITVPVVGDTAFEPNETFFVNLSNPTSGAVIARSQAVGTILNDDGGATFLGPTPYLSKADSPFLANIDAGRTYLETMECGAIIVPGVTASTGSVIPPGFAGLIDSVDADDGSIDGSGLNGHSFFAGSGSTGIDFTFSAAVLGALPTEAGIVWTDGGGTTTFEAFDGLGTSLGQIGPVSIADGSNAGTTAEDRFFGVRFAGGISRIHISNTSGGIEVDHLQYGLYDTTAASADLSIVKTDSPDPVAVGAALTYTLAVSNAGPSATCSAVTVTDTLPAGVSFVSGAGPGWSCSAVGSVVTCSHAALGIGAAPLLTIQVTAPSSPGSITNTAVVSSQTPDLVLSNNTASATTTVGVQPADLQVTKTGPATVTAGSNVVYSIIVKNNGPGDASAVTVSDATPAGLTFVSNSGACVTAFPCSLGTVNNGQMLLITSTFAVPLSYSGPDILNTASVSSSTADPTPGNNSSTATTTVTSGPPSLSIGSVAVIKPASGTIAAVFPVTMSRPSAFDVSVSYASADGTAHSPADYQGVAASLLIPAGSTTGSITVLVKGNTIASDDKFFTVALFNPVNAVVAGGSATGLIQDRTPLPSLSIGDVNVTPGGSGTTPAAFVVTLSAATDRTVSVNYATADGTATVGNNDYLPSSGTLFFAPGETSKTINVSVVGKPFIAPSNFFVDLSPAVNATVSRARGTASINRAFPSLSVGDAAVQTPGTAVFVVTLSVASTQPVTVSFATADRTAFAGIDYTALSGVLTFAPGETSKSVTVALLPGGTVFPTKVFQLILSNASGAILAKSLGEAAIYDQSRPLPPGPYIFIDDVSVVRPGSSFALWASVPVRLTGPSAVTINLSYATVDGTAHGGTDYLPTSGTLTIAPGETMKRILVPVLRQPAGTPGRSFQVSLGSPVFGEVIPAASATVSIIPPSP